MLFMCICMDIMYFCANTAKKSVMITFKKMKHVSLYCPFRLLGERTTGQYYSIKISIIVSAAKSHIYGYMLLVLVNYKTSGEFCSFSFLTTHSRKQPPNTHTENSQLNIFICLRLSLFPGDEEMECFFSPTFSSFDRI